MPATCAIDMISYIMFSQDSSQVHEIYYILYSCQLGYFTLFCTTIACIVSLSELHEESESE